MKKSLIVLAALAAGSAFADSSVTLYGSADAFFGQTSNTLPTATALPGPLAPLSGLTPLMNRSTLSPYAKNSQTVVNSGGLGPSRLGIRVKEDLGNGLYALANFEQELQLDAGAMGGAARTSVVGLGGSWGRLTLGRQATPLKDASVRLSDAQAESAFSAFSRAVAVSLTNDRSPFTQRISNSIRYDLPESADGGFRGAIAAGTALPSEYGPSRDRIFGLSIGYVVPGSWAVGFSHQTERNGQNTVPVPPAPGATGIAVGGQKITLNYLSGAVGTPIGKITLGFGGGKVSGVSGHDRGWNIGWTAPIDNWTLIAQYASFKASGELGNLYNTGNAYRATPALLPAPALAAGLSMRSGGARRSSFGVEARYSLSKRSTVYAGYNYTKNLAGIAGAKASIWGVGMRHDF